MFASSLRGFKRYSTEKQIISIFYYVKLTQSKGELIVSKYSYYTLSNYIFMIFF